MGSVLWNFHAKLIGAVNHVVVYLREQLTAFAIAAGS